MSKPDESTAQAAEPACVTLNPYRIDWVYRIMRKVARGSPFYTGLAYMVPSLVVPVILALSVGEDKTIIAPGGRMLAVGLGLFAPVGAGLLCSFYEKAKKTFNKVEAADLLPEEQHERYFDIVNNLDKFYNNIYLNLICLVGSILINAYFHFEKARGSWLFIDGGVTGQYCRFMATLNLYMISMVGIKMIWTCWYLKKVFSLDIKVHPLHPDGVGGLLPFGELTLAINYFLIFGVAYFGLMYKFVPRVRQVVFVLMLVAVYIISPIFMFGTLWRAHQKMAMARDVILGKLSKTFDHYCGWLGRAHTEVPCNLDSAQEVKKINVIYQAVDKMSLWPFPVASLKKYATTLALPLALFIFQEFAGDISILQWVFDWLGESEPGPKPVIDGFGMLACQISSFF